MDNFLAFHSFAVYWRKKQWRHLCTMLKWSFPNCFFIRKYIQAGPNFFVLQRAIKLFYKPGRIRAWKFRHMQISIHLSLRKNCRNDNWRKNHEWEFGFRKILKFKDMVCSIIEQFHVTILNFNVTHCTNAIECQECGIRSPHILTKASRKEPDILKKSLKPTLSQSHLFNCLSVLVVFKYLKDAWN